MAANSSSRGRDLRLDLFRGLANWAIFLDHIPNNVVAWLTTRNYGFSDAADLFVFISGYTAALAYSKTMSDSGFLAGAVRLARRVWQLYVAHVLLFLFYIAAIGWVAQRGWARMTFQDAEAKQYRFCEANRMRRALRTTFAGRWAL